jgi:hypothetical protein
VAHSCVVAPGTRIASLTGVRPVLRTVMMNPKRWPCHWSRITNRTLDGREVQTVVWICEHPYRTIRLAPCDCADAKPVRALHPLAS